MGYTILMQWTPAAPSRTSTSDLVLSRVLEHYNFRTFRATFPTTSEDGTTTNTTRILSTVTYSQPIPPVRDVPVPTGARDDCTYLFLEDRGVKVEPKEGPKAEAKPGEKKQEEKTEGEKKDGDKTDADKKDKDGDVEMKTEKVEEKKKDEPIEIKDDLEEDGFEIIDEPKAAAPAPTAAPAAAPAPPAAEAAPPAPPRPRQRFKTLAVKPATSVMPTLHNLLSPFVLGLTKQARAGSSTTGQAAAPSPLQGTSMVITSLTFPPPAHPQPPLALSVHIIPNAATIFLEAEWEGTAPSASNRAVLEEFLRGCVPDGAEGTGRVLAWEGEESEGWTGIEKTRRMTTVLCRALRESNLI